MLLEHVLQLSFFPGGCSAYALEAAAQCETKHSKWDGGNGMCSLLHS